MIFLGEFSFLFSDSSISGEGLYPPAQAAPKGQKLPRVTHISEKKLKNIFSPLSGKAAEKSVSPNKYGLPLHLSLITYRLSLRGSAPLDIQTDMMHNMVQSESQGGADVDDYHTCRGLHCRCAA